MTDAASSAGASHVSSIPASADSTLRFLGASLVPESWASAEYENTSRIRNEAVIVATRSSRRSRSGIKTLSIDIL